MNKTSKRELIINFIDKYILYFVFGFAILALLPYVSVFNALEANNNAGIIYRGIVTGLLGILFLIGLVCYRKLPNKLVIGCSLLYFITQAITIVASPLIKSIEVPVLQQVVGYGLIFTNIISVFLILYFENIYKPNFEVLTIIFYFLLGIGIASCLYTYIFQYKEIGSVLSDQYGWNYQVTSVYSTKGIYGFILLIVSIYTVIHALNTKKYWYYAFVVFFLFNSFICRAKTTIVCLFIILLAVLIHHLIHSWKEYKKQWTIALSVGAGLILIFSLLTFVPGMQFGPFKGLNHFMTQTIFNDGITVTKDRIEKVSRIFAAVDYPLGIMFGCGERITNYIIAPAGAEIRGDNMYAANYATGGIIKFVLYLSIAAYAIYKVTKRKNEEFEFFSILFIVIILLTGLCDDNSIIGINISFLFTAPFMYSSVFKTRD